MSRLPWDKPPHAAPPPSGPPRYLTKAERLLAGQAIHYVADHRLALCLLRRGTKIPILRQWNDPLRVLSSVDQVNAALVPEEHGIGVVHELSRTCALDVDDVKACKALFAEFGWDYDELLGRFPRIRSREGKDKILARLPEGFKPGKDGVRSKTVLRWPDPNGVCDEHGQPATFTVMELRGGQNQDVLPPSIHPDTQQPYEWVRSPGDFTDGIPEIPADHPLLTIWRQWEQFKPQLEAACPWVEPDALATTAAPVVVAPKIGMDVIGKFNRSLVCGEILERNGYKKKGRRWLAPNSSTKIPGVVRISEHKVYSHHGSDVLQTGHAHDAFSLLTVLEHGGSVEAALKAAAELLGIPQVGPIADMDFSDLIRNAQAKAALAPAPPAQQLPAREPGGIPQHLIDEAPGMVGEIVRWGLDTAIRPQPALTLQAAFAAASAAAGRRYCTDRNNWPSLWYLNIDKTASGKEHGKTIVEEILDAGGLSHLIGGSGYTSPGAVFSALLDRPSHVSIIDEIGKMIQSSQSSGHQQKSDAITTLMESFGRCHGVLRPQAYSTMGANKATRESLAERSIHNPAIAILAMTTPSRFYDSLSRAWVADGFLGRFLVCHSAVGRKPARYPTQKSVPPHIAAWIGEIGGGNGDGDLASLSIPSLPPIPEFMTFSQEAARLFAALDADVIRRMDAADSYGLDALYGRSVEKAMRLSMLVCLAEHPEGREIGGSQAQYAIDYVMSVDEALVESAKWNIADSDFGRIKNRCLADVRAAGERGLTLYELNRKSSSFKALRPREQGEVLAGLQSAGLVGFLEVVRKSGLGRKRTAWVAIDKGDEDSGESACGDSA